MIIEVQHDRLSATASKLQQQTISQLAAIQSGNKNVAHHAIPQAGASDDLRAFQVNLEAYSQEDLGNLINAFTGLINVLQSIKNNYEQAQISAITRALLL